MGEWSVKGFLFFLYGVVSYVIFFVTFLYIIAFLGPFEMPEMMGITLVPKTVDSGVEGPLGAALVINIGLILLFGVQHSVMARPGFKERWTRFVPAPIERSSYVLLSSVLLILLYWQWCPMTGVAWQVDNPIGFWILTGLYFGGYLLVLYASFLIDHFDLFGLRQVFIHLRGREYTQPPFAVPFLYRMIRHPLLAGWIIAFWATPRMTYGHLLFAVGLTLYMLIAIPIEEKDLAHFLGEDYKEYRARTPMLLPWPRRTTVA